MAKSDTATLKVPKIAIAGVGTAGCHMIDVLAKSNIDKQARLVAVDNEIDGVESTSADVKIAMYKGYPGTLHQPWTAERGKEGALEVYDEILAALKW